MFETIPDATSEPMLPTTESPAPFTSPGRMYLTVIGQRGVTSHLLPAGGQLSIGRSPRCDICIDDPGVSRRHALLQPGSPLRLIDLGSANGTQVRGRRLPAREAVDISTDDVIELGGVLLVAQELSSPPRARHLCLRRGRGREDGVMQRLERMVERFARSNISVLILGETGVGKEVMAETLHRMSPRRSQAFLRLNCAALSESLLESELFGHERGAFTGAHQAKLGLLESAHGGTVFLDEIGELPLATQVRLLRVLEERTVLPVGGLKPRPIDVRFVAATNRDLEQAIVAGTFRQDLYYRLDGVSVTIPPLRNRVEEIQELALAFAARALSASGRSIQPQLEPEAVRLLEGYAWPGNIRELRNVIERAVLLGGGHIMAEHLPVERLRTAAVAAPAAVTPDDDDDGLRQTVVDAERRKIVSALAACSGNQTLAAKYLGIARRTLVKKLKQHRIPRPRAS